MKRTYITEGNWSKCLGHVVEECGEVLAASGKLMRHGPYSVNPEIPIEERETNLVWLKRELNDLKEAIARFERCEDP